MYLLLRIEFHGIFVSRSMCIFLTDLIDFDTPIFSIKGLLKVILSFLTFERNNFQNLILKNRLNLNLI